MLRAGDEDRRDRVLVRIRVVAENAGGGHGKRGVLIGAVRVVVRDGRIVEDTVDLDVVDHPATEAVVVDIAGVEVEPDLDVLVHVGVEAENTVDPDGGQRRIRRIGGVAP